MDLISIIVPVYNAEKTIDKCLKSLLRQSCGFVEIVAVDDGSTDASSEIIGQYAARDERVKLIEQTNQGVVAARVNGLKNSKGNYIAFVDADDDIEPDMVEKMYNILCEEKADISVCGYNVVYDNHKEECIFSQHRILSNSYDIMDAYFNGGIKGFLCNKLYKRELISDLPWPEGMNICEDLYFNALIVSRNKQLKIVVLQEALYNYYMNNESATHNFDKLITATGDWKYLNAYQKIEGLFSEENITRMIKLTEAKCVQFGIRMLRGMKQYKFARKKLHAIAQGQVKLVINSELTLKEKIIWIAECILRVHI